MNSETASDWVAQARRIVVFSGAGISAESGVPTFRDAMTGLWARFSPEELATESAFRADPQRVWSWYVERRAAVGRVQPNAGHQAVAAFQRRHPGRLTVVTQNVDGLHQRAGSAPVLALHGDLMADRWLDPPRACCGAGPALESLPPRCATCGNLRRPAVVWFGEMLPVDTFAAAEQACRDSDLMLVVGTSGAVWPAAGLVHAAREAGARVVVVNPQPSELDGLADLRLAEASAACLPALLG